MGHLSSFGQIDSTAAPVLPFVLVTGHDRQPVGNLCWPNIGPCKKLCGDLDEDVDPEVLLQHPALEFFLCEALILFNSEQQGSSTRITRIMFMSEPPDSDAAESTVKGDINQRTSLQWRKAVVEQCYAEQAGAGAIVL